MAALLAGSWRESPPPAEDDGDLEELAPLLHRAGAAALTWARLRHRDRDGPALRPPRGSWAAAAVMQDAYRLQKLGAALHRRHLAHVLEVFRAHGVEPVLIKGWAAARLYPDEGLRPQGDIDLWVRPEEGRDAGRAALAITADCSVDLHVGLRFLDDRPLEEVYRRCKDVPLGDARVRVLGREDHLRLLAVHMLGHGAWRPAWLTDVAVALETRAATFDWAWFQSGSARRTQWAGAALRLSHSLLGAAMDGVPVAIAQGPLPRWVAAAVLEAWGDDRRREPQGARLPMRNLTQVAAVVGALRDRWPSPLEATVGRGAAISSFPRLPVQLAECVARVARFAHTRMRESRGAATPVL